MFSGRLFAIIRTLFPVTMQQSALRDEEDFEPLARIDSVDASVSKLVREFLESFGTRVAGPGKTLEKITYYVVIGDDDFVKSKLEDIFPKPERTIVIVFSSTNSFVESLVSKFNCKAVLVDPKIPDSRQLNEIFAFFFTSKEKVKDMRTDKSERAVLKNLDYQSVDYSESDRLRIKKSINAIFADEKKSQKTTPLAKEKKNKKQLGFLRKTFLSIFLFFLILFFPFFWYGVSIVVSGVTLFFAANEIYHGNLSLGEKINDFSSSFISQGKASLSIASIPLVFVNRHQTIRNQERLLSFFSDINSALENFGSLADKGREVAGLMLTTATGTDADSQRTPALALSQLQSEILAEGDKLGMAATELSYMLSRSSFPFSIAKVKNYGLKAQTELSKVRQNINYINSFLALYPDIAGFKSKKIYLVLFQNSMELRPTGGFIGSIATVSFDTGRLSDLVIQDVYELDGQLKGHVDPPAPIRDLLGEEHWYLRDSNWDPDFIRSAERASWFYEKETERKVDGVIAVSSPFLVDMLKATGPIELRDYNDRITADNFYGKSLYYTQNNFFPGSTQKKDFLGSLANAIIGKITSDEGNTDPHVFFTAAGALNRGDILLYFNDPQVETIVTRFGWAGTYPKNFSCFTQDGCLEDDISVVEANLGVNKANYYVNRDVQNKITFSEDGKMEKTISINYQNKSSADRPSNGSGPYRVYLRFFLPEDAVFAGGTFDSVKIAKHSPNNKAQVLPYYDEENVNSLKVVSVALTVPESSTKKLVMTFKRNKALSFSDGVADFRLLYARQPGLANTSVGTEIVFPIFWNVDQSSGGSLSFLAKQADLKYNTRLSEDQKIEIKFSK